MQKRSQRGGCGGQRTYGVGVVGPPDLSPAKGKREIRKSEIETAWKERQSRGQKEKQERK